MQMNKPLADTSAENLFEKINQVFRIFRWKKKEAAEIVNGNIGARVDVPLKVIELQDVMM